MVHVIMEFCEGTIGPIFKFLLNSVTCMAVLDGFGLDSVQKVAFEL